MSRSGVTLQSECVAKFNELKLGKKINYIIYKLTDDLNEIIVAESGISKDWDTFRQIIDPKTSSPEPRFAIYDFSYKLEEGGERSKITFIAWSPDDAKIKSKMVYASSKETLKLSLNGIAAEIQANDSEDLEYSSVFPKVSKGK